jgi:hypothetical protein
VDLKDVLGDVDADRANLDHGWPSVVALLDEPPFWHNSMPLRGPSTPSIIGAINLFLLYPELARRFENDLGLAFIETHAPRDLDHLAAQRTDAGKLPRVFAKDHPSKRIVRILAAHVDECHARTRGNMDTIDHPLNSHCLTDIGGCISWGDGFRDDETGRRSKSAVEQRSQTAV